MENVNVFTIFSGMQVDNVSDVTNSRMDLIA
jgi:hypothetical protein